MEWTLDNRLPGARSVRILSLLRWVFCILLLIILIPSGSVEFQPLHSAAAGFLGIACLAVVLGRRNGTIQGVYLTALCVTLLLGGWIIIQASAFEGNPLANPIWAEAARIYGPMPQSISVSPGDTMAGLVTALLPFVVFMTVLLLFDSDERAVNLIRVIVISGMGLCLIGLVQFVFFPSTLLFEPKKHYLDSLTTVFVNRNTAATYIGMVLIFSGGLAFHALQSAGPRSFLRFLVNAPHQTKRSDALLVILYAFGFGIAYLDLMLTKSRAGIGATMIGLTCMAVILAYFGAETAKRRSRTDFGTRRTSLWIKLARVAVVLAAISTVALIFGGQAISRAGAQGTTDLRFCFFPSLVEMTRDNWLVGTGLGTFRDVFPAYRNPACGMDGVLVQAHDFYLEGWISLGLPFVIATIVVVVMLFFHLAQGVRARRQYRWIPAAGIAALILQLLHNGVDFSIQNPGVAVIFAALMAASVVISRGRPPKTSKRTAEANADAQLMQEQSNTSTANFK